MFIQQKITSSFIFLVKFAIFGKTVKSQAKTNRASLATRFFRAWRRLLVFASRSDLFTRWSLALVIGYLNIIMPTWD